MILADLEVKTKYNTDVYLLICACLREELNLSLLLTKRRGTEGYSSV